MNTRRLLMLVCFLAAPSFCDAQGITNAGWYRAQNRPAPGAVSGVAPESGDSLNPPCIAEATSPEIQALSRGLENDPLRIFNYVHDHIPYVLYFGSKKGAALTLLEESGNDFDQCALLVALLRAARYTNSGYQFGWNGVPLDNPDGSKRDLRHWLGLTLPNTNSMYTS